MSQTWPIKLTIHTTGQSTRTKSGPSAILQPRPDGRCNGPGCTTGRKDVHCCHQLKVIKILRRPKNNEESGMYSLFKRLNAFFRDRLLARALARPTESFEPLLLRPLATPQIPGGHFLTASRPPSRHRLLPGSHRLLDRRYQDQRCDHCPE